MMCKVLWLVRGLCFPRYGGVAGMTWAKNCLETLQIMFSGNQAVEKNAGTRVVVSGMGVGLYTLVFSGFVLFSFSTG